MTVVEDVRLVSNSEVQTLKDCPRRWWLAWHRGLKPRRRQVIDARSTGQRMHVALAALYTPNGSIRDATKALLYAQRADRRDLDAQLLRETFYESEEIYNAVVEAEKSLTSAFDLEHAMLEGYLEWMQETGVDENLEVVSVEQRVEIELPLELSRTARWRIGTVKLIAKLDARVRNTLTGAIKFIDHKTVGTLHDPTLGINQQMLHYHAVEELANPDGPRSEGALYNMLRKVKRTRSAKPPFYARIPIDHNKFELEGYGRQLYGIIDRFEKLEPALERHPDLHQMIVPPRPSRDCAWKCDFFKICRMFDDGSRVEAAIEEHYETGDPLAYYDTEETSEGSV